MSDSGVLIGSLFSGAGMLEHAVQSVFGGDIAWQSEINPAACTVLAHRFPGVINLGDVSDIDWATVQPVDIMCGGFPCQDVSAAGRRAGITEGTRSGLWHVFRTAIAELRPRIVVIENVKGLLSAKATRPNRLGYRPTDVDGGQLRAAGAVLGDLAEIGYDAQWTTIAASDVGAPHQRARVVILATDASDAAIDRKRPCPQPWQGSAVAVDSACDGRNQGWPQPAWQQRRSDAAVCRDGHVALLPTPAACNPNDGESQTTWLARREVVKDRVGNGNGMGMPLSIAVQLLPTPRKSDGDGGTNPLSRPERMDDVETRVVRLLQTPSTADGDGSRKARGGNRSNEPLLPGQAVAMAQAWGKYAPAIHRWENATRRAPTPTEPNTKGNPRLAPAFPEWMMGWPAAWATAYITTHRRARTGEITRNDALRIIGNGVCPQQIAAALYYLFTIYQLGVSNSV